jgi:hypothetical protein
MLAVGTSGMKDIKTLLSGWKQEDREYMIKTFDALYKQPLRIQIILLATAVDDALTRILKKYLKAPRTKREDELFGVMRPLGSFSAKIEMAYRLALIPKQMARCYDLLRNIRNDCAHKMLLEHQVYSSDKLNAFVNAAVKAHSIQQLISNRSEVWKKDELFWFSGSVCLGFLHARLADIEPVIDSLASNDE